MRTAIPLETGIIHFVGIGGIGMSGIAEILHNLGYQIQGSDASDNANVKRLREKGITVFIRQRANNIQAAEVVVVSTAIKADNPELIAAKTARLPIVKRADMLAELVRLKWSIGIGGTHGKTTTTTMVAAMLEAGGFDPTVINGGIINAYGTNTRLGQGEWIVVEADESDGTFLRLRPTIAVVTNIDPEHLDHYGDFATLKEAFENFVQNVPFYGCGIVCLDHPVVQAMIPSIPDRKLRTYGFSLQADVRASNITALPNGSRFDIELEGRIIKGVTLPMPGEHNIQNALAAVCVACQLQIDDDTIRRGLAQFSGVKRRFTKTGEANGVSVIDDYGHHPVEIQAVLKTARSICAGKVIAVVQPHRFSRVHDLWDDFSTCFNHADTVIVSPIYTAGEPPIEGINQYTLAESIRSCGHKDVQVLEDLETLAPHLYPQITAGDFIICLGAGTITTYANTLPQNLVDYGAKQPQKVRG